MKHLYTFLLFAVFILPSSIYAQECTYSEKLGEFQANFVRTYFNPAGDKFWDREVGGFHVPDMGKETPSTLFAGNVWVAAHDENADLHVSANAFYQPFRNDFAPGPLVQTSPGDTSIYDPLYCNLFDRVWSVNRKSILDHIQDIQDNGVIDQQRPDIFGWPGEGNTFFENIHGFDLPMHHGGWAPFFDQNGNGTYEPDLGDYPHVLLEGNAHIPDQILWLVFNDIGGAKNSSNGVPLKVEIQLTAYAFFCSDNPLLNHSIFNSYKIINQSNHTYSDFYFGQWMDPDVGCFTDDFIGSDPHRNTVFAYNEDSLDGNVGIQCTGSGVLSYGDQPPVQAMTFINQPMTYSGYFLNGALMGSNPAVTDPGTDIEYYHYLTGKWRDGTPWTAGGMGYNPGSTDDVTHVFPGNPNNPNEWSLYSSEAPSGDRRTISSTRYDTLKSFDQVQMDIAYSFHTSPDSNNIETVNLMYENINELWDWVKSPSLNCNQITEFCNSDCVWPGDFNTDGIVDHFDYLNLGLANNSTGAARNGLVNWQGHTAENWDSAFLNGLNMKHADANGDGLVDTTDLILHSRHDGYRNENYHPVLAYPIGDEIGFDLQTSNVTLTSGGTIRFDLISQLEIDDVYGLAFTLAFDTTLFQTSIFVPVNPIDQENVIQFQQSSRDNRYAIVLDGHTSGKIEQGKKIATVFLSQKNEVPPNLLPDSTLIRLLNLTAIDETGEQLDIGFQPLVIYKEQTTGTKGLQAISHDVSIYPNPTDGLVHIVQNTLIYDELFLYDAQGHLLRKVRLSDSRKQLIDLSDEQRGFYILKLINDKYETHQSVLLAN